MDSIVYVFFSNLRCFIIQCTFMRFGYYNNLYHYVCITKLYLMTVKTWLQI